jgi:hypothetical protein
MAMTAGTSVHHPTQLKLYLLKQEIFDGFYDKDCNIWTTQGLFSSQIWIRFFFFRIYLIKL